MQGLRGLQNRQLLVLAQYWKKKRKPKLDEKYLTLPIAFGLKEVIQNLQFIKLVAGLVAYSAQVRLPQRVLSPAQ